MKILFPVLTAIAIAGSLLHSATAQEYQLTTGVTSVALDTALLQSAAGLTLTDTNFTAAPANSSFAGGFAFAPATNFVFSDSGSFQPISGAILHFGSLTFNNSLTVGDFLIGYDPTRNLGSDSGFFLKDSINNLTLFDLSQPSVAISTATDTLRLSDVNLLVAPELSSFLANSGLTGAKVGSVQVDADFVVVPEPGMFSLLFAGVCVCAAVTAIRRRGVVTV